MVTFLQLSSQAGLCGVWLLSRLALIDGPAWGAGANVWTSVYSGKTNRVLYHGTRCTLSTRASTWVSTKEWSGPVSQRENHTHSDGALTMRHLRQSVCSFSKISELPDQMQWWVMETGVSSNLKQHTQFYLIISMIVSAIARLFFYFFNSTLFLLRRLLL